MKTALKTPGNGSGLLAAPARDVVGRYVQRLVERIIRKDKDAIGAYEKEPEHIRKDILRILKLEDFPSVAWLRMRSDKVDGDLKDLHTIVKAAAKAGKFRAIEPLMGS